MTGSNSTVSPNVKLIGFVEEITGVVRRVATTFVITFEDPRARNVCAAVTVGVPLRIIVEFASDGENGDVTALLLASTNCSPSGRKLHSYRRFPAKELGYRAVSSTLVIGVFTVKGTFELGIAAIEIRSVPIAIVITLEMTNEVFVLPRP